MTLPRPRPRIVGALLLVAAAAAGQAPPPAPAPTPSPTPTTVREGVPVRRVTGSVASATKDGNRALLDKRPDDALALYSKAQVVAPEIPEIEYNRGLAALLAGDATEASKAFAATLDLAKPNPQIEPVSETLLDDSRFNAAHAEWAQDHLTEAIQGWASVVAKDPAAVDARRNLEMALRLLQQEQQQQKQEQQKQNQERKEEEKQEQDSSGEQPQQQPPGQQPQGQDQPPEEEPRQESAPSQGELTKDQAEDLLEALEAVEKQDMKEKRDKQARRVVDAGGKDW